MSKVEKNNRVKVHYTGKLQDGQVFDSSREREPLEFTVGEGKLIKGFENAVIGMEISETKTVNIPSEQAYGPVMDELKQEVKKQELPDELNPEVGMELVSQQPDGRQIPVKIVDVTDQTVTVDANHPLAGKDLTFEIEILEIAS